MILELLHEAENLREYHSGRKRFSSTLAAKIGDALGVIHRLIPESIEYVDIHGLWGQPPWILSIHHPNLNIFRDVSSANFELIRIVQQNPELCWHLDALRQEWRNEALIHGDIKWENCLAFKKSPSTRKVGLKIVDWELANIGDPCWDVGSFFSTYLAFWLASMPITADLELEQSTELARYPLESVHPAIRSFSRSYVKRMALDAATRDRLLIRAMSYGAARLIQTTYEQMETSMQLTKRALYSLQLGLNIMRRPQEAMVQLLGIELQRTELQ